MCQCISNRKGRGRHTRWGWRVLYLSLPAQLSLGLSPSSAYHLDFRFTIFINLKLVVFDVDSVSISSKHHATNQGGFFKV